MTPTGTPGPQKVTKMTPKTTKNQPKFDEYFGRV
jgi:hypothetical protein